MKRVAFLISWRRRDTDWLAIALTGDVGLLRPFQALPAVLGQGR
jgi:hypothetical protein